MEIKNISGYSLKNLNKLNILLGKNGAGKSVLLREVEKNLAAQDRSIILTRYITPERGGALVYQAGIEQNITANITWLPERRRRNQANQFKEESVAHYRKLEYSVLRDIEKDREKPSFDNYVEEVNSLLDHIQIVREEYGFKIINKKDNSPINAGQISSGESELISLAIECLVFSREADNNGENILFLDEPDVHLHPDLQCRFMHFLKKLIDDNNFRVILATHSTAIIGALEDYEDVNIGFLGSGQKEVSFELILKYYEKVLPIFGAHPLSNIFNQRPILLVEGEDDERVWQQAVRTSRGKIKIYPCICDTINKMNRHEIIAKKVLLSVYDDPKGYSLRDRDDNTETIDDSPPIVRMRLSCRTIENLILCDEVLSHIGLNWVEMKKLIDKWLENNKTHTHFKLVKKFKDSGYDRKNDENVKKVRNDLMGICATKKAWEVILGQVLGNLTWTDTTDFNAEGSIYNFLGEKTVSNLIPKS